MLHVGQGGSQIQNLHAPKVGKKCEDTERNIPTE
jgi:hypothetical protein